MMIDDQSFNQSINQSQSYHSIIESWEAIPEGWLYRIECCGRISHDGLDNRNKEMVLSYMFHAFDTCLMQQIYRRPRQRPLSDD